MDDSKRMIMMRTVQIQNEMVKRIKNAQAARERRQNPVFREKERMRNLIATRLRRQDPEVREKERERNRIAMRIKRQNPEFRAKERHAMVMRKLISNICVEPVVQIQYPPMVEYESRMHHLSQMQQQALKNIKEVNRSLPLELEMRVDEEDADDPDEIESKNYSEDHDESQEEIMPVPVEVTITPYEEEFQVKEEGDSVDSSTLHEEVDIKEEQEENNEEELQPPLEVNIKEEPEETTMPGFSSEIVDIEEGHNSEDFVEESIPVKTQLKNGRRQRLASKRGECLGQFVGFLNALDTVYRCPNCSLCYTSPEYLAGHVRRGCRYRPTPIKNAYLCVICGEGFNNYGHLYQHKRQKHSDASTAGNEKIFLSETTVRNILKLSVNVPCTVSKPAKVPKFPAAGQNVQQRSFRCPNCPRTFTASGYLVQHQRSHVRQQTDHSCDLCGENLRHKPRAEVEAHFAEKHSSKDMHRCAHCDRIYGQRQNLVTHLQTHGEYECFVCNVQFSCQQLLTEHFRTHATNQPFECDICHKIYWQLGRYHEHRRKAHNIVENPNSTPVKRNVKNQNIEVNTHSGEKASADDDDEVQVVSIVVSSKK
ncbi:Zinc finger and SCAN domain-containing protein 20 [Gryllus bimaculatus]|nr:Zinc finger and SCAN domain-containing protein 20 [Gryllus bimaculatus]